VLAVGITAILIGELAVVLTGDGRARIAAVFYALASATGFADNVQPANTELFLNLPLTAAAFASAMTLTAESVDRALLLAIAAGALTATAALFKYQAALAGVGWLVAGFVGTRRGRGAVIAAGLGAGFAAVAAAVIAHYARDGHLDAFLFWGWRYNFTYIGSMPLGREAVRATTRTLVIGLFWLPLVAAAVASRASVRRAPALALLWLACMAAAVGTGGRFFGNYYLMLLPPLSILAGAGVVRRWMLASAAALAAASVVAAAAWPTLRPASTREDNRYRDVGAWLQAHSSPGERLFVWGDSAQLYAYSRRRMGTRFAFTNYQTGKIWGTGADEDGASARPDLIVPRAWDELLADFHRAPPDLIVDAAAGGLHGFAGHGMPFYPALWKIVSGEYRQVATVDGMPVYHVQRPVNASLLPARVGRQP
jgi:hypothetical protein